MQYKIEGRDPYEQWDESLAGDDPAANRFESVSDAWEALAQLLFDTPEYAETDWRIVPCDPDDTHYTIVE